MRTAEEHGRFDGVARIAVLRGGGLGDLIFVLPALESLKAAYPEAELTLLGTAAHAALLADFDSPVDAVEVLPRIPGINPSGAGDGTAAERHAFADRLRSPRYDLAVQLNGGGRNSNPFLLELDARHTVGMRTPDAMPLERCIDYIYYQHEVLRALE